MLHLFHRWKKIEEDSNTKSKEYIIESCEICGKRKERRIELVQKVNFVSADRNWSIR